MKRFVALLIFSFVALAEAASPVLTLKNELVASPAPVGSNAPKLRLDSAGRVELSWQERDSDGPLQLRSALFLREKTAWSQSHSVSESTRPEASSVESTTVRSHGANVAKAWFVPSSKEPQILLSTSSDGGHQFLMPVRVDDISPTGAPDLVVLQDGTVFITWPERAAENASTLWLRRISRGGTLSVPVLLATTNSTAPAPRLALLKDFDAEPAKLIVTYTAGTGEASQILTRLLTIDPPTNEARRNTCATCPDPDETARGYAIRGTIVSVSREGGTLAVRHSEIADILPAGTTRFKADAIVVNNAEPAQEFFGRIEKRGNEWWLFDLRWVVRASPPR
ncbi:MAG: hypothetical protein QM790_19720 [Nibricoccus sp.]